MSPTWRTTRAQSMCSQHVEVRRLARLGAAGLVAAAVVGCQGGASVTVDISVPRPLVQPLDVHMGVYFDDQLKSYVHEEELEDYGDYRIDIGASQVPVFAQVFDAMFDRVVPVVQETTADGEREGEPLAQGEPSAGEREGERLAQGEPSADDATAAPSASATSPAVTYRPVDGPRIPFDGILAPSIDEVQFAIPDQTGGEFYEVWIRYNLKLLGADGALLGEWPVIGYGKANQRNYGAIDQKEVALNEATIWALRDAAAWLSFQFPDQAEVQTWLASLGDMP